MTPQLGSPPLAVGFQLLPSQNLPDLHPTPQPPIFSPQQGQPPIPCPLQGRVQPPFFTSLCFPPGLATEASRCWQGVTLQRWGRPTPSLQGQAGPQREWGVCAPGDVATKELLPPDGHSSREAGDLDFYIKYTKF